MAASLSVLSLNSVPKMGSNPVLSVNRVRALIQRNFGSIPSRFGSNYGKFSSTRLNAAGLSEIEPDLNEDPKDRWATNGISQLRFLTSIISHYMSVTLLDDFVYGEYDGHHTYHEGHEKASFWESIAEDYTAIGPPTGFQGLISWLFLPAVAAGMYFNVRGEYLYIGAAVFTVIFCIIEMDKPSEPHNFEPQIYNMERGSRDKLIADYNTMDIWDFNEKYGDLWDFTVKKDDIMKR